MALPRRRLLVTAGSLLATAGCGAVGDRFALGERPDGDVVEAVSLSWLEERVGTDGDTATFALAVEVTLSSAPGVVFRQNRPVGEPFHRVEVPGRVQLAGDGGVLDPLPASTVVYAAVPGPASGQSVGSHTVGTGSSDDGR